MDTKDQPVLKKLVKSVLQDLAKVIIDYPKDKKAETGCFELVYKAKNEVQRPKDSMTCDLKVDGVHIHPPGLDNLMVMRNNYGNI